MVIYLILILFIRNVSGITTPVIILDPSATLKHGIVSGNPFHETSSKAFIEIVEDAIHLSNNIVIFIEENFSAEDVSRKDAKGTPFKNLHKNFLEEKAMYIPSVVDPCRTLQRHLPPADPNVIYLKDNRDSIQLNSGFKYLYVYFERSSNNSRIEMLRHHDELIIEAYEKLAKFRQGPIIIFYTGKWNPMQGLGRSGYRKPTPRELAPDAVMKVGNKALIRLSGVVLQQGTARSPKNFPTVSAQSFARTRLSTRMLYDEFELDFNFEYLRDSWLLDSVVLLEGGEEVGRTPMGVGAPYDWSYYCSEPLMLVNTRDKSYVTISRYQVEPLRARRAWDQGDGYGGKGKPKKPKDGAAGARRDDGDGDGAGAGGNDGDGAGAGGNDGGGGGAGGDDGGGGGAGGDDGGGGGAGGADGGGGGGNKPADDTGAATDKDSFTNTVNCGTNFNCRILSGLFVVAIVMSITMCGVIILYDCRSNGRMDDPNQKPLVIVAQL